MDKDSKKLEEQEVWQNPKKTGELPETVQPATEQRATEREIVEELAQIKAATQTINPPPEPPPPEETEIVEVASEPIREPSNLGTIIRWLGNFLILISIIGLVFTFWPLVTAEVTYRIEKLKGIRFTVDRPQGGQGESEKVTFGDLLGRGSPKILIPKSTEFGVIVEKIGANAPVVPEVNAANPKEYNARLQKGVAHAKGSVYPGEKGLTYLFAHSTLNPWDVPRYNAVFYLLRELGPGDRVVLFYKNVRYDYLVTEKKVVAPNDVSIFSQNFQEPVLVLQTCDPPGTTWRRLIVVAKMKSS